MFCLEKRPPQSKEINSFDIEWHKKLKFLKQILGSWSKITKSLIWILMLYSKMNLQLCSLVPHLAAVPATRIRFLASCLIIVHLSFIIILYYLIILYFYVLHIYLHFKKISKIIYFLFYAMLIAFVFVTIYVATDPEIRRR